jgi:hypothetical protein
MNEKAIVKWINKERAKYNLKPIRKIHKGRPYSLSCPISNSLSYQSTKRFTVNKSVYSIWFGPSSSSVDLPPYVKKFIRHYDNYELPQYTL